MTGKGRPGDTRKKPIGPERRQKRLRKLSARAALLLPAMLFATGIAQCLFFGQALTLPGADIALWTCIATLAICILLYNRYTMLGGALIAGIAALILWRAVEPERLAELLTLLQEILAYISGFLFGETPYDPLYDASLFPAIIVLCSAVSAVLVYRLRSALAAALLALVLFMLEWSLGSGEILSALWPAMAGCALIMAMRGFKHAPRKPPQMIALAASVALIACGLTAVVTPERTVTMRSPMVERALDNVNDLFSDYTGYQRPHASFSIAGMGYQPLGDRLGGAVVLPDMDVLRVNTTSPRLLRGTVRNYYSGSAWMRSTSVRTFRLGNPLIAGRERDIMGTDVPQIGDLEQHFARESTFRVTHLVNLGSTLFTAGRVRSVSPNNREIITNFDENTEAFAKRYIEGGSSYTVTARVPSVNQASFPALIGTMYHQDLLEADDQEVTDRNAFLYLGLPEATPEWISEESHRVIEAARAQTDWDKAFALMEYLKRNFTYTLEPVDPPEGEDFVAFFLESGEGYCTYFASAMAVMARTIDLPSRYVEGFLLEGSQRVEGGYLVNAKQAHAWAEIYIEGIGWLPFDATPRQSTSTPSNAMSGYVEMPTPTPPPPDAEGLEDLPLSAGRFLQIPWWAYPIALAVLLAALFFALLAGHDRRWSSEALEKRVPDEAERLSVIWRDILRQLALLGSGMRPGETPYTYAARIDDAVENPEGHLRSVAEPLVRSRYGGIAPASSQIDFANAYRGELDVQIRKSAGRVRFLFLRALTRMPLP